MKIQAKAPNNIAFLEDSDSGEGLAVFFSQGVNDTQRWRLDILARLDTGADILVGIVYVSPPTATNPSGVPTRQVAAAICPGAKSWSVITKPSLLTGQEATSECAQIELASSPCCTSPVGVNRVNERYGYASGNAGGGSSIYQVLPGQTITRIEAHGTAAGSILFSGGNTIVVANGQVVVLEPKALIEPNTNITFTNVSFLIEYKESA